MQHERLTEFSVFLAQRPGELVGLLDATAQAGVEIIALSTTDFRDRGLVRLIGAPTEALRGACEQIADSGAGQFIEAPVIAVGMENRPNAVRDLAVLMADARINVRYTYLAPSFNGSQPRAIFAVDDFDGAVAAIDGFNWPAHANGQPNGQPNGLGTGQGDAAPNPADAITPPENRHRPAS